jgi:transcription antitermination factor NusG
MINWFVINTRPKKEFQVAKIFSEAGFEYYSPVYKYENRVKPFFPGYGFLLFEFPQHYQLVKFTRGVKRVVGNQDGPIPIPEETIQAIKAREVGGLVEFEKHGQEPAVGDEIEVVEGPLRGLKGVFKREIGDKERVLILLSYVSYQGQLIIEKNKLKKILT